MTNEDSFKVRKQPDPTCPMIDSLIKRSNEIMKIIDGYGRANEEELRSMADDVDTSIRYFEDKLDEIRIHIEQIRAWGQDWKEVALDLNEQLDAYNDPAK